MSSSSQLPSGSPKSAGTLVVSTDDGAVAEGLDDEGAVEDDVVDVDVDAVDEEVVKNAGIKDGAFDGSVEEAEGRVAEPGTVGDGMLDAVKFGDQALDAGTGKLEATGF